ncbi:esterase/lipase family protein [Streptomyces monticola]|uniref:Esterase/lipase family protein n=1 Tax=Streptomyces monticola TaxID=2666263 RepID=A0ABW2JST5_9ACTN
MLAKRFRLLLVSLISLLLAGSALLASGMPANAATAPPPRGDSVDEPLYLIHGFDNSVVPRKLGNGWTCEGYVDNDGNWRRGYWDEAQGALRSWGWTGEIRTYGYYSSNENCDLEYVERNPEMPPGGDRDTPLTELARFLAHDIYAKYSSQGKSVDVLAHSMGGLIIQSALTEVSKGNPDFPPYLYVEDVVTLSSPHGGTNWGYVCNNYFIRFGQCDEMKPNSDFLANQIKNPQSAQQTDWTTVGSERDPVVRSGSATSMPVDHKVVYKPEAAINHISIFTETSGSFPMRFLNTPDTQWQHANGAAPIRVASNALYWHRAW